MSTVKKQQNGECFSDVSKTTKNSAFEERKKSRTTIKVIQTTV